MITLKLLIMKQNGLQEIVATHNTKDALLGEKGGFKALTAGVLQAAFNGELPNLRLHKTSTYKNR